MGTDIHLFIETVASGDTQAEAWSDGEIKLTLVATEWQRWRETAIPKTAGAFSQRKDQ
jgi:hypothetical protein